MAIATSPGDRAMLLRALSRGLCAAAIGGAHVSNVGISRTNKQGQNLWFRQR
jgi:hypothetical protein